jgi:glycosyltransferase involved in cell wall biosynthesis
MSQSGAPRFTIAIVCLNAGPYLAEALGSVVDQDYESYEVVIIDGGSTDGTLDIIREFAGRLGDRMRWSSEPDDGLYHAMNKALRAARGDYVAYLGADDRLANGALQAVEGALLSAAWPDIVAGAVRVFGGAREWIEAPRSFAHRSMPKRAPARHQSIYVARWALIDGGGFDTGFRIAADYDLYLRLIESGAREVLVDDVLSEFRLGGVSSANAGRTAREYRDVRIAHGSDPLWQRLVMMKSLAAAGLVSAVRGTGKAKRSGV